MGIDPTIAIRIALGTNLLVVLPTALNGALAHHKRGAVIWNAGIALGITAIIGACIGAIIASRFSSSGALFSAYFLELWELPAAESTYR